MRKETPRDDVSLVDRLCKNNYTTVTQSGKIHKTKVKYFHPYHNNDARNG